VDLLTEIGGRYGHTPGEVALAWVLHNPAVTAAIVGLRKPEQIHGTIGAQTFRLTDNDVSEIEFYLKNSYQVASA
jgi:aryl-alcohol dehydrogenase-like predicted oxidoreductase